MGDSRKDPVTEELENCELEQLAPYALKSKERRGSLGTSFREHDEPTPLECRTEYHRDRDRIVWSRAFKRMQHKTQVFPHYVEDHYRRRLTHALEVAQIATTVARALKLNEAATEAIALGHDLGHAPFGHAGERALNKKLVDLLKGRKFKKFKGKKYPVPVFGFDHCVHSVEVVSRVEREYCMGNSGYYGLNLTFDVRDGILKHMRKDPKRRGPLSTVKKVVKYPSFAKFEDNMGSLEAQCVYFADKVAYLLGDIEDGIRGDIFSCNELEKDHFIEAVWAEHRKRRPEEHLERLNISDVDSYLGFRRKALAALILNVRETAEEQIRDQGIGSIDDVFTYNQRIVEVSENLESSWDSFRDQWMIGQLYKHKDVMAAEFKAVKIITDLFDAYMESQDLIDHDYYGNSCQVYRNLGITDERVLHLITVRNYIAGMTDPFAAHQHSRLFTASEHVR